MARLGWGADNDLGVRNVGHGGGQQGKRTFIMIAPERQAGVVVLLNFEGGDASTLARELMKDLVGMGAANPK